MSLPKHVLVLGMDERSLINFRKPLLEALLRKGCKVTTAALPVPPFILNALQEMGIDFVEVPISRGRMNPFADIKSVLALARLFRRLRPDIIIGYSPKPVIYGALACRLAGVGRFCGMITGLGFAFIDGADVKRRVAQYISKALYRVALRQCSSIIFHNHDDREAFQAMGLLPQHVRVGIVNGSGVDLQQFTRTPLPQEPIFIMVSRLLADKGVREYAEACRLLRNVIPGARTMLLGSLDPSPSSLGQAELDALVAGGMEYLGFAEDVRPALAAASVVVLPSYREGMPRSILEGLAMGRPVITCDVAGCRETVTNGENGLIVPPRDPHALYEAMFKLGSSPVMRAQMGAKSRRLAVSKFDAHSVALETLALVDPDL